MFLFFDKKKKKAIETFAKEQVAILLKKYPPDFNRQGQRRVSEKRLTKMLESSYVDSVNFAKENSLGVYGKAKLANSYRWELEDHGYDKQFVELAAEGLTVYLTKAKK